MIAGFVRWSAGSRPYRVRAGQVILEQSGVGPIQRAGKALNTRPRPPTSIVIVPTVPRGSVGLASALQVASGGRISVPCASLHSTDLGLG
jgi:hypothetical protein